MRKPEAAGSDVITAASDLRPFFFFFHFQFRNSALRILFPFSRRPRRRGYFELNWIGLNWISVKRESRLHNPTVFFIVWLKWIEGGGAKRSRIPQKLPDSGRPQFLKHLSNFFWHFCCCCCCCCLVNHAEQSFKWFFVGIPLVICYRKLTKTLDNRFYPNRNRLSRSLI